MTPTKKREGFKGQRAIVIPGKILSQHFDTHPIVKQLYITDIGYYPNAQYHYRHRSHGVNQNILIYCTKGQGWVKIREKKYTLSAGDFVLLPAGTPHEYAADEQAPWTIYWLHFKGTDSTEFVDMMLKKMGDHVASISFQENRLQLFEEIYKSLERGYSLDNICYATLSLQYFLGSCCFDNNYLVTSQKTDSISLCVNYLQKNIDKPLSLHDIANTVNLSVSHFASVFKRSTGFSVIEYFNQLKTQKACQYLQFTDLRINEVADRLGIEDPHYFSRMFTKIVGMSPNKYRNRKKTSVHSGILR
jgi:AraC-like DNA-binding protein/mannose-6-phosphate isomerase-like protein (cupin superfamily)